MLTQVDLRTLVRWWILPTATSGSVTVAAAPGTSNSNGTVTTGGVTGTSASTAAPGRSYSVGTVTIPTPPSPEPESVPLPLFYLSSFGMPPSPIYRHSDEMASGNPLRYDSRMHMSFADRNRDAFQHDTNPPGAPSRPAAKPTWGRAVSPSGAGTSGSDAIGPQETGPSLLATAATLAVVGGLFWWVTSGPKMARANPGDPDYRRKLLSQDVRTALHSYAPDAEGVFTKWKAGKSGGLVVSGIAIAHRPRLRRELESVAREHSMTFDAIPTQADMEFGLTTIVFTPESTYRFNPRKNPADDS